MNENGTLSTHSTNNNVSWTYGIWKGYVSVI
jgi:hypothetical protein